MIIYLDSLFFINCAMSFIITKIVGRLVNQKYGFSISLKRYLFGSILSSSIYIMSILSNTIRNNFNFVFTILILSINVYITFQPKSIKIFLTYFISVHLVAFAVGGMCFGLFYYTKVGAILGNTVTQTMNNISIKLLFASIGISYTIARSIGVYIEKLKLSKKKVINVKICDRKEICVQMLLDTGNSLTDPYSQLPVVVVFYEELEGVLDDKIFNIYKENEDIVTKAFQLDDEISKMLKIIPFKSLGRESGLILGFESNIEFSYEDKTYYKKCVIGISDFEINKSGEYAGIFNPSLIEEEMESVKRILA